LGYGGSDADNSLAVVNGSESSICQERSSQPECVYCERFKALPTRRAAIIADTAPITMSAQVPSVGTAVTGVEA